MSALPPTTSTMATAIDVAIQKLHVPTPLCVTVTGSGGKTTTIEQLALLWAAQGYSVLVTTTTKMANPSRYRYPFTNIIISERNEPIAVQAKSGEITLIGIQGSDEAKIEAPDELLLTKIIGSFDRVLIEGDGARNLPLKFHDNRDPVIPEWTCLVIGVVGLGAFGAPLDDQVMYNVAHFKDCTRYGGEFVNLDVYKLLLSHPEGVCKGAARLPLFLLFNQSDMVNKKTITEIHRLCKEHRSPSMIGCIGGSWMTDRVDWVEMFDR